MHNPVFEESDTLSFVLMAYTILYINDKQFKCSVFTFVQYIYTKKPHMIMTYEPVHEISNNVVCATSKASDQPDVQIVALQS